MVLIESNFVDRNSVSLLKSGERGEYDLLHRLVQDRLPILDRDLDVAVALGDVVVPVPHSVLGFDIRRCHIRLLYSTRRHSSLPRGQGVLAGVIKWLLYHLSTTAPR